jgi:FAD/FMN-containing dehydrogenase
VLKHTPSARAPLDASSPWYVLLEVSDTDSEARAQGAIEAVLATALDRGLVTDGVVSASVAQFEALWALREGISDAQAAEGRAIKHDISLPISTIPAFIDSTGAALGRAFPDVRVVAFGHLGDGNLHYNLSPLPGAPANDERFGALEGPANRLVHDAVVAAEGSISAEHGLGVLRRDEAVHYKSELEMRLMRDIKAALDPRGLLNPGKLLRTEATPSHD